MERLETVVINSLVRKVPVDIERLQAGIARGLDLLEAEMGEVGVVLTTDEHIKTLNARYRRIDAPTDVLSFPLLRDKSPQNKDILQEPDLLEELPPLGDIIISIETAARQAEERGHSLDDEVTFLALHGLLHLVGIHHDTEQDAEYRQKIDTLTQTVLGRNIPH